MWNSIDNLKVISHYLMWASAILAILAAVATGIRYYVDHRASELSSQAQHDRETKLNNQVERNLSMKMRHLQQQFSVASDRYLVTPVC